MMQFSRHQHLFKSLDCEQTRAMKFFERAHRIDWWQAFFE